MKRMTWRTALFGGLICCGSSAGLWAQAPAEVKTKGDSSDAVLAQGKGKDGGGGRGENPGTGGGGTPGGGRGDNPGAGGAGNLGGGRGGNPGAGGAGNPGGGRNPRGNGENRGGSAPHSGNRDRLPPGAVPTVPSDVVPRIPGNRSPSFSRPNLGRPPGAGTSPSVRIRPPVNSGDRIPGANGPRVTLRPGNVIPGVQGDADVRIGQQRPGTNRSHIGNHPFNGNTVTFNNRQFHVGHGSYQPSYYRHNNYHGYWNGNRGNNWNSSGFGYGVGYHSGNYGYGWGLWNGYGNHHGGYGGYRYRPFGWGLGGWGLGSVYYNSGYLGYSNPYYVTTDNTFYNYSQPIPVSYNAPVAVVENAPNSADEAFNNAVEAFRSNDYDAALDITNKGITQHPDDAVLHEFRSLVLFAKGDYQQSAGTIHSVLAVGPGWDWTTLIGLYATASIYTDHLRNLEAFTKANPQDAGSHFLLAYHYMTCGHTDDAVRQLRVVVQLMPNDRVAADILKMIDAPLPTQTEGTVAPRPAEVAATPAAPSIVAATMVGSWKAARADGSAFDLNLNNDSTFTWSFAQQGQAAQEFGGTYTVEGNVLALERKGGGSLIAEITPAGNSKFNFKMLGAPAEDLGLDFQK